MDTTTLSMEEEFYYDVVLPQELAAHDFNRKAKRAERRKKTAHKGRKQYSSNRLSYNTKKFYDSLTDERCKSKARQEMKTHFEDVLEACLV